MFSIVRWYKLNKLTKALSVAKYNYRKYYHIENERKKYNNQINKLLYEIQEMRD